MSLSLGISLPVHSSSLPPLFKLRRNIISGLKFNSISSKRRVSHVPYRSRQEDSPLKEISNKELHESLLAKTRNMFCDIDAVSYQDPQHIGKMLSLLDVIHSMGISHHFQAEIRQILDIIFRTWKDDVIITKNLNNLALSFLMLRLNKYEISQDVFREFIDKNGNLDIEVSTEEGLITTLNLFRASIIQFPNEQIIKQAHTFCLLSLKEWFSKNSKTTKYPKHLIEQVRYALAYPWQLSSPRWEALNFIHIYSANIKWLRQHLSMKETFSEEVKICFIFVMKTYKEIINSCSIKQGYNMEQILLPKWIGQLEAFELEARWFAEKKIPSTDEYLRNGFESVSLWPLFTIARLLTYKFSCHPKDLKNELKINSELYKVCAQSVRIHNDLLEESKEGSVTKEISIVDCYMKERPWEKREDVTEMLQKMAREHGKTLSKLFLNPNRIGEYERVAFEVTRALHFLYKGARCFTSYAEDKALDLKECANRLFFQEII